jgi:hypothetical protein
VVTIRVVAAPLLGIARERQVSLVIEKLPEEQVQHFVQHHGRSVRRFWSAPEWWAQGNGISWERDNGRGCGARVNERGGSTTGVGGNRTAEVWHARSKAISRSFEAMGDKVCGGTVVSPWDGTRRISEEPPEQS